MENIKDKIISVRVTEDLRVSLDAMRDKYFPDMQISSFVAYLIRIGLDEEDTRIKERELKKEARLKKASMVEDIPAYEERGTGTRGR